MTSDAERDLLASDTELSGRGKVDTQFSSHLGSNPSACTQDQAFHQFVQLLDSKLDQKLATFKRSLEEKEEFQASQLKKSNHRPRQKQLLVSSHSVFSPFVSSFVPVVNHSRPPTSASAADSTTIGQALQSAAIDIEPIAVVPQQQLQSPVADVTADVTELRHKAAAERLEKDEYLNYCAISSSLEVMRPWIKHWRSKANKIVVYLNDGMGVCPSFTLSIQQACGVKSDL